MIGKYVNTLGLFLPLIYAQAHCEWVKCELPGAGQVNALAYDERGFYAGTDHGIYISRDDSVWNKFPGGFEGEKIQKIFTNRKSIFFGSNGGLQVSRNSGISWDYLDYFDSVDVAGIGSFAIKDSLLVVAGSWHLGLTGVYRSPDNGLTWSRADSGMDATREKTSMAFSGSRLFALQTGISITPGHSGDARVFRSDNGGKNWLPVQAIDNPNSTFLAAWDTNVFVGTDGEGIYVSHDGGEGWKQVDSGLPRLGVVRGIVTARDFIIANVNEGELYYSFDQGDSWQPLYPALPDKELIVEMMLKGSRLFVAKKDQTLWNLYLPQSSIFVPSAIRNRVTAGPGPGCCEKPLGKTGTFYSPAGRRMEARHGKIPAGWTIPYRIQKP